MQWGCTDWPIGRVPSQVGTRGVSTSSSAVHSPSSEQCRSPASGHSSLLLSLSG